MNFKTLQSRKLITGVRKGLCFHGKGVPITGLAPRRATAESQQTVPEGWRNLHTLKSP